MGKPKKIPQQDDKIVKMDKLRSTINFQKKEIHRLERKIRELEKDFENAGVEPKKRVEQPKQTKADKEALANQKKVELKAKLKAQFGGKKTCQRKRKK